MNGYTAALGKMLLEGAAAEGRLIEAEAGVKYAWKEFSSGNLGLTVWTGKGFKPVYDYRVTDHEAGGKVVEEYITRAKAWAARKAADKVARKAATAKMRETVKVGTLLHDTSSYNMTFVNFYEVVGVKGATATVREIASEVVTGDGGYTGTKKPVPGEFVSEKTEKLRIGANGVGKMGLTTADRTHYFNSLD